MTSPHPTIDNPLTFQLKKQKQKNSDKISKNLGLYNSSLIHYVMDRMSVMTSRTKFRSLWRLVRHISFQVGMYKLCNKSWRDERESNKLCVLPKKKTSDTQMPSKEIELVLAHLNVISKKQL